MKTFLEEIAEKICTSHHGQDNRLDKIAVVFNNRRPAIYLRKKIVDFIKGKTIFMPSILGMNNLIETLGHQKIIENEFLLFELFEIHKEIEGEESKYATFEEFISFGDLMIKDFSELDLYCVDAKQIFYYLYDEKGIEQWDVSNPDGLSDFQQRYLKFYQSLYNYYFKLRERLAAIGESYSGMAYRNVAEKIEDIIDQSPYEYIYFVGFNALSESEKRIVKAFCARGKGELITDGDAYYYDDPDHEAGLFLRRQNETFPIKEKYAAHFGDGEKKIKILSCSENIQQVKYAGQLIEELQMNNNDTLEQTAVVLADEKMLVPMLNSLPDSVEKVNITMGYPYTQSSVHALSLKLLDLHIHKKEERYYHKDVIALLSDSVLGMAKANENASNDIQKNHIPYLSTDKIQEYLTQQQWEKIGMLFEDSCCEVNGWLRMAKDFGTTIYNDQHIQHNEKERESIGCWIEMLQYLQGLQTKHNNFITDLKTLKKIYDRLSQHRSISFFGEPLTGLQILGMLETRNLDFKRIILLSANEGIVPAGHKGNSLIPIGIKNIFHIPTYTEKDAVYANHFYCLLQRAEEIYLIYHTDSDGIGKGEASRYIAQIRDELAPKYTNIDVEEQVVAISSTTPSANNAITIEKDEAIYEKIKQNAENGFSPSALNMYRNCPLQYYYTYILGIRDNDKDVEELDSSEMGTCVHEILKSIYEKDKDKGLQLTTLDVRLNNYINDINAFFDSLPQTGRNHLWKTIAQKEIANVLNYDKLLLGKKEIQIIDLEKMIEVAANINGMTVKLKGTIDRIDSLDGTTRILDYKTGSVDGKDLKTSQENIDDPSANSNIKDKLFQVMFYAWLYCNGTAIEIENINGGIYALRYKQNCYKDIAIGKSTTITKNHIDTFYTNHIVPIVEELLDKNKPFAANDKPSCDYCKMKEFCKKKA